MSTVGLVVIGAEVATFLFFAIYLAALTIGIIEDRAVGRVPALDATGRALFRAARYGFTTGIAAVVILTLWNIAESIA
jgi:hypothetical protein